jgi:hypothetical protein
MREYLEMSNKLFAVGSINFLICLLWYLSKWNKLIESSSMQSLLNKLFKLKLGVRIRNVYVQDIFVVIFSYFYDRSSFGSHIWIIFSSINLRLPSSIYIS